MRVSHLGWHKVGSNVVMWSSLFFLFPLMTSVNGCFCEQPQCCQYLMAPSSVYVQMNPSAYGIVSPAISSSASSTIHPSTTAPEQIFANHLQWTIMTGKPWDHGSNVYYAVSSQGTQSPDAPTIDLNQPTLYFMPNWWNTIQEAVHIPKTSPFAIQFNNPAVIPSQSSPHQPTYHSYPPLNEDHPEPQPAATITVLNEQPDLLPQSAKDAQNLLQEIQRQLEKINNQDQKPKDASITTTLLPPISTTKQSSVDTATQPVARIVSADNLTKDVKSDKSDESRPHSRKKFKDEPPVRSPKKFSHETDEIEEKEEKEDRRRHSSMVTREHRFETGGDSNNLAINSFASLALLIIQFLHIL